MRKEPQTKSSFLCSVGPIFHVEKTVQDEFFNNGFLEFGPKSKTIFLAILLLTLPKRKERKNRQIYEEKCDKRGVKRKKG